MTEKRKKGEGFKAVVEMLNVMDGPSRDALLTNVARQDPSLAADLVNDLFAFEDLVHYEQEGIRELLRLVPRETLLLALRRASDALQAHLFHSLSKRAFEMFREDLQTMGPRKVSEIEEAQRRVMAIAKDLAAQGKLQRATP